MTDSDRKCIEECYVTYCDVIKPLIANIEAQSELLPLPVFNEIRAFNDHIARCYYNNPSEDYIHQQVDRANRHIVRITLDCFKCLNVIYYRKIELFDTQTRNVDLTVIDNGMFYPEYTRLRREAAEKVKMAKSAETYNVEESLNYYQESYNLYSGLVGKIDEVAEKVKWAKVRFRIRRILTVIAWIMSVVISAIVSAIFSCEIISYLVK